MKEVKTAGDRCQYVVADYYGTGDGVTKAYLVTYAYATAEQREDGLSPTEVAKEQFKDCFGFFLASGAEVVGKNTFLENHAQFLPEYVKRVVTGDATMPANFQYEGKIHINYS